jgi:predicted nucleic acid-binding protein
LIVVDTSAWVELLRATASRVDRTLTRLLEEERDLAVTEAVVLEVLAGAATPRRGEELRSMLLRFPVLELGGLAGFEQAAELFRVCRRAGEPLRSLVDCLIAAPTIAADATLLAADRDFEKLARHTPLRLEPLDD